MITTPSSFFTGMMCVAHRKLEPGQRKSSWLETGLLVFGDLEQGYYIYEVIKTI